MTPQELKNSVLQLAIQGKLVEQRPEEGTADTIVNALLEKKKEWSTSGRILKKADTKPFYSEDELSELDIPDSWSWVQLANVSIIQEGAGIRKWQYRDSGTQILCVTNILEGAIDLEKKQLYISSEEYMEKYQHLTPCIGDIVTSCSGGSWGKTAIFDCNETMMLNTSTLRLRFFDDLADNMYLYYITKSTFFKRQLERQLAGMQPNFGYAHYSRIMIPFPPLAEQKRIVAKIEELLPLIDRYEAAWSRLEEFNKRFPGDMQKSLLQMAIQGKLVEQRPEEGTGEELYTQIQAEKQALIKSGKIKKEKPLPEITEDEKPFDIPESWKWVLLDELVCKPIKRGKSPTYTAKSGTLVFAQKCNTKKGYIDISLALYLDESKLSKYPEEEFMRDKDIVINSTGGGTMGRVGFYQDGDNPDNIPIVPDSHVTTVRVADGVCAEYILYVIKTYQPYMEKQGSGSTNQTELNAAIIRALQIPLPPLAEQKRIVAKLEELLPLCERLK